jgi:hypothetical protein
MEPKLRELRQKLGCAREKNIFVTASGRIDLSDYRCFDGEHVDAIVVTTKAGGARIEQSKQNSDVRIIVAGEATVDLPCMVETLRREVGIQYLCPAWLRPFAGRLAFNIFFAKVDQHFTETCPERALLMRSS